MTGLIFRISIFTLFAGHAFSQNPVTFQCDMSIQVQEGKFNPLNDTLVVRGSFNGYGNQDALSDDDQDSIYSVVVDIPDLLVGFNIEYNYAIVYSTGEDFWESIPRRIFIPRSGGQILVVVYFNDQSNPATFVEKIINMGSPRILKLGQNYPNPFNQDTRFDYELLSEANMSVFVHNVHGQVMKVLVDHKQPAGLFTLTWDGTDQNGKEVSSGVFLVYFVIGGNKEIKKIICLR